MTTRYCAETECEHGKVEPHWYDDWKSPPKVRTWCPGGQRRELTGVEIVEIGQDMVGQDVMVPSLANFKSGTYAIIPLDE